MRPLDPALEAALNAEAEPYLQLQYCIDGGFDWLDAPNPMYKYKLGNLEFNLSTVAPHASFPWYAVRLKHGCYVNHIPIYETSSTYYVNNTFITEKTGIEIEASIIPKGNSQNYTIDGHQTYGEIISSICNDFGGYTATFETPANPIWDNIFYPTGRTLVLQSPHAIFTLLRQKLFIYAQDDMANQIYFRQWLDDGVVGTVGHPSLETIITFDWKEQYIFNQRHLIWRDEAETIHHYPDPVFFPNLPIYNLGYLESTAATPTSWQTWHENEDKRTFHLKYRDGDIIHCSSGTYQIQVTEIFHRKESPSLYLQFKALRKFTTTEGGPLPGTIEAAAPYTPLNVSYFNKNLNSSVNNLQALAEAVDELTAGPAMYAGSAKDPLVDADVFPVIDSETTSHLVRKFTWLNLKDRIFAAFGLSTDAAGAKATPVDGDLIPLIDSEVAGRLVRKFTWANLKTMLLSAWDDWVPSYSALDPMTFTSVTTTYARYIVIGKVCHFMMRAAGTTGGTATGEIHFTLPILPSALGSNPYACVASVVDAGVTNVGRGRIDTGINECVVHAQVAGVDGNFTLGAGRVIFASGFYEID